MFMKDILMPVSEIHQNPLVIDYLNSRYFIGFQLKATDTQITLASSDSTIIALLTRAKFIKDDENEEQIAVNIAGLVGKRIAIKNAIRDMRMQYDTEAVELIEA